MNCPIDSSELLITDRQGIEIDYCPKCRGVWLDRGELDKLLDRAAVAAPAPPAPAAERVPYDRYEQAPPPPRDSRRDDRSGRYDDDDDGYGRRPRRRRSFLDDLFDFD
jgi:Zn-finger nucleic acid-binding protein